ncbi:hypothetical protein EC988_001307, partial [Linderina pennispora]
IDEMSAAEVRNSEVLEHASRLLGFDSDTLLGLLTVKTKQVGNDKYTVYLDSDGAVARRDDLARSLYSLLFNWMTEFINSKVCKEDADRHNFIGLVDFPGWYTVRSSTYEQMVNNYTSERLQHFMFHQIFEAGNAEYEAEGIVDALPSVEFPDRTMCLDLFMKGKTGLFATMDRQAVEYLSPEKTGKKGKKSAGPREFDATVSDRQASVQLLSAFNKLHNSRTGDSNPYFSSGESKNEMNSFTVAHFWGSVSYNVDDFVEKNLDQLSADFVAVFRGDGTGENPGTGNGFVAGLFSSKTLATEVHPRNEKAVVQAQAPSVPTRAPSMMRSKKGGHSRVAKVACVVTQYQRALNDLIATLDDTLPWFTLCIKPNEQGRPHWTDARRVQAQTDCFSLDAIVRRKRAEFSAVLGISDFCQRYASVIEDYVATVDPEDPRAQVLALKQALQLSDSDMVIAESKVFLNYSAWRRIDDPIRGIERMELGNKRRDRKESRAISSTYDATAGDGYQDTLGSQSEANLMLNAQPLGQHNAADIGGLSAQQARALKGRMLGGGGNDTRSYYSDDDGYQDMGVNGSEIMSEREFAPGYDTTTPGSASRAASLKQGVSGAVNEDDEDEPEHPKTRARKYWLCCVWANTFWVPSPLLKCCGRIKRRDQRLAWREKLTLCLIIFWSCIFVVFWIVGLGLILCPKQHVYSLSELTEHQETNDALIAIRGEVFDVKNLNHFNINVDYLKKRNFLGRDQTALFPQQLSFVCPFPDLDPRLALSPRPELYTPTYFHDHRWWRHPTDKGYNYYQMRLMRMMRENHHKGHVAFDPKDLLKEAQGHSKGSSDKEIYRSIIHQQVFDLSDYINSKGARYTVVPVGQPNSTNMITKKLFLDPDVFTMFQQNRGQDITEKWDAYFADKPDSKALHKRCLRGAFYIGDVDLRRSARCYAANYLLLAGSIALVLLIFVKFIAALQFGSRREPEPGDNFIVCNVPCYTEGEDSLKNTIDSLARLKYDDKRKLLFIVCDGMIMGSGNDRPTPRIVLDILGVDRDQEPEALSYIALGEGSKEHNMAKVYSGLYEIAGHVVPYLVIVKCGTPNERNRPGNRGKRDSQIMLMRFFNKVFFDLPMVPLELEMYHQVKNVIGVNPAFYEYVLMIDADTVVFPDSLNRLVGAMAHDQKILGICGETTLANAKSSWITMMQVYEYFISHHLTKAFESLFGSVSCLPGCFSMYRMRTADSARPLLISNQIIEEYSTNRVETLHEKNLLHLGEDRYLTTLVLKHFPYYKNKFVPDAKCMTNAPDQLSILLSQRRRWINSTVHNLFELIFLPQLCGFCCFSMRFVVFIDLITTIIMPATLVYLAYLIYQLTNPDSTTSYISLYLLAAIYGMQALIFILKRQWQHIGWMIVYIIAIPLFSFLIPIYAFWHFDDFSWGNTRVVVGESGRKHIYTVDNEKFDTTTIPQRKWSDYEQELLWEAHSASHHDGGSQYGGAMSDAGSKLAAAHNVRSGSAIGNVPQSMLGYANTQSMYNANSVYNDGGYGYNPMGVNNMTVNPMAGNGIDYLGSVSGRASPMIMPTSNAYEMVPMGSVGPQSRVGSMVMPQVVDPRLSQVSGNPFMQQDPRMSAYSVGSNVAANQMMMGGMQQPMMHPATMMEQPVPVSANMDQAGVLNMFPASDPSVTAASSLAQQSWPSGIPDEQISGYVAEIIATADLMTITKKQVREQIMSRFGIQAEEAKARRDFINQCIGQELQKRS